MGDGVCVCVCVCVCERERERVGVRGSAGNLGYSVITTATVWVRVLGQDLVHHSKVLRFLCTHELVPVRKLLCGKKKKCFLQNEREWSGGVRIGECD